MKLRTVIRQLTIPLRLAGQEIYKARATLLNPENFRKNPPKSWLSKRPRSKQRKTRQHDKHVQCHIDEFIFILQPILRKRRVQMRQTVWSLTKRYRQQYLTTYFRSKRKRETLTNYRNVRLRSTIPNTIVVNGSSRSIMTYLHDPTSFLDTDDNT
jgi:hypothetical protein